LDAEAYNRVLIWMTLLRFSTGWKAWMVLIDVNVLVYAHRLESAGHLAYRRWLEDLVNSDQPYGMADMVLGSFIRIMTHPRIFHVPTPLETAMGYAAALRNRANCVIVTPGSRHWETFEYLCQVAGAKGNLVTDAYLAALAIESGSEWITTDRDYSRFPGLRWRHPLQ
jgi:toxin-antitoxin system PIN domain toxin